LEGDFEFCKVLALGGELACNFGHPVGVLPLAFLKDLGGCVVLLLDVGLNDLGDGLVLTDVIAHRNCDRLQPSGSGGYGVDDLTAPADQDSLARDAGRHAPKDAPQHGRHKRDAQHKGKNPISGLGDNNDMIELLGRRSPVKGRGAKCPLRSVGHALMLWCSERFRRRHICTQCNL
jgi:hypothetical protein